MSYTVTPYLIDLEVLRRAVGSKDEAFLSAVIQGDPDRFRGEEAGGDKVSLGRALRHLVMGETPEPKWAYQYGYALEQLCRHLGEPLPGDLWSGIHWEVVEETGLDELFDRSGPPVPLPPTADFPTIAFLGAGEIAATVAGLGDGHLTSAGSSGRRRSLPNPRSLLRGFILSALRRAVGIQRPALDEEGRRELLKEYEGWLRHAASEHKSLVFFYY
jgi:hypothetical protein